MKENDKANFGSMNFTEGFSITGTLGEINNQNQQNNVEAIIINEHLYNPSLSLEVNTSLNIQNNASFVGEINATCSAASQDFIFIEEGGKIKAGTRINSGPTSEIFTLANDIEGPITICLGSHREVILDSFSHHAQQLNFEIHDNENQPYNFGPMVINDHHNLPNLIMRGNATNITIENGGSVFGTIDAKAIDINCNILTIKEGGILKAGTQIIPGAFDEPRIITIEKDIHGPATISVGDQRQVVVHQPLSLNDEKNNVFEMLVFSNTENTDEKENIGKNHIDSSEEEN